jgi:hypothetical protein
MNDKYKLVKSDKKAWDGTPLFQVVATKDFGDVERGDVGGYVASEKNLSVSGNAWVYGDAQVFIGKGDIKIGAENEKKSELLKKADELIAKAEELKAEAERV